METSQVTIKHWRAFGIEEWGHVKEGAIGLVLGSLLPVALFYVAYRSWGFSAAGLVSQTALPDGAPISAVTLYLAWPSLENLVYGAAFFGSALLGRPLLALF